MKEKLLVTIWNESCIKSFAFDPESQSMMYVGLGARVSAEDALVCVELVGGSVTIRPEGDSLLYTPMALDVPVASQVLDDVVPIVCGVRSSRCAGMANVFVRPVEQGIGCYRRLRFRQGAELLIGRGRECDLRYGSPYVSARHARLAYSDDAFLIEDLRSGNGTFVNGRALASHQPRWLLPGDTVQILDLTIMVGKGFVLANSPECLSMKRDAPLDRCVAQEMGGMTAVVPKKRCSSGGESGFQTKGSPLPTFYPAPRLARSVHPLSLSVDAPPQKSESQDMPALLQVGPSFLMGLTSIFMAANCVSTLLGGGRALQTLPTLAMSVGMLGGSVVWPLVSRAYNRRRERTKEELRCQMYVAYLDAVENELQAEADSQAVVLRENRLSVKTLLTRAAETSPLLMNRTCDHEDFMDLRVGLGDCELEADVAWPKRGFTLAEDPMLSKVERLARRPPSLHDVPLCFNPLNNRVTGILGERRVVWEFLRGLFVQICAFYSYNEVKILLVADESEREEWTFLMSVGHIYHGRDGQRLVALTDDGVLAKDLLLEHELDVVETHETHARTDSQVYYVVVCTNVALANRSEIVARISSGRVRDGAMLIYAGSELRELPKECTYIIDLASDAGMRLGVECDSRAAGAQDSGGHACMFDRTDVSGTLRTFTPDIMVTREAADAFALQMALVHLDDALDRGSMPESLGFLEMYGVGNAFHLNVLQRWSESDASRSLQTLVGVDARGERATLNLHENIHGPHGLIAGTTGSGKSEFIITYILSLCVSYAPDEVAFVIIDYKGGGLAGAFHNDRYHLPHLAGTITNLDGSSINRSLISIRSELRRRQEAFNEAREVSGEATMDIYKYLSLYRQGVLEEPLPHLFIIADEFAELKQQEPEFMDELVSAARIGRSLGVHLILATQKPTGVVDDQIWSNARAKISLKVADASDSREMIRRDDAARLSRPGEFYLLVGYDESFWSGQAAYAGLPYVARDRFEPRRDDAVELLDAEGETIASLKPPVVARSQETSELNAVLEQIEHAAKVCGKQARRLWLDPLPEQVSLMELKQRYGLWVGDGLTCVVGEADDPGNQRRFLYALDLLQVGNAVLYGSQSSGVEDVLVAMATSMAMVWGSDRLWLYGVDYGDGRLGQLRRLKHMGGVVCAGDDERLETFLRMLETEIARRRSLVVTRDQRRGDGDAGEDVPPRIVVCVANLASLMDAHAELEDRLISITRDAPRVGVHFLVTSSAANAVRMRLRANFGAHIPTMLNDMGDYLSILGSLRGVTPPTQERRGLMRLGKALYEFQGASIGRTGEEEKEVIDLIASCSDGPDGPVPPPIPRLPQRVLAAHMNGCAGAKRLPVGFAKLDIAPLCLDLHKTPCAMVLGNDADALTSYLRGVWETLSQWSVASYVFVDPQGMLGQTGDSCVLSSLDEVKAYVEGLSRTSVLSDLLIFTNVVQTLEWLEDDASVRLKDHLERMARAGEGLLVVASEYWRTKSLYEDWYRAIAAHGSGVWVGGGFADQTAFSLARQLPEYRRKAVQSDGFVAMGGEVTSVRLVGPSV